MNLGIILKIYKSNFLTILLTKINYLLSKQVLIICQP